MVFETLPKYKQALAVINSGAAPVKGERQTRSRLSPEQLERIRENSRERGKRHYNKKGSARYSVTINAQRRWLASAGRSVKRTWEPWEDDILKRFSKVSSRILALGLNRSIRSVQNRRYSVRFLAGIYRNPADNKTPADKLEKVRVRNESAGVFPVRRWTDEDHHYLLKHRNEDILTLAKSLKRSINSVKREKQRILRGR